MGYVLTSTPEICPARRLVLPIHHYTVTSPLIPHFILTQPDLHILAAVKVEVCWLPDVSLAGGGSNPIISPHLAQIACVCFSWPCVHGSFGLSPESGALPGETDCWVKQSLSLSLSLSRLSPSLSGFSGVFILRWRHFCLHLFDTTNK